MRRFLSIECSNCGKFLGTYYGEEFIIEFMGNVEFKENSIRTVCLNCWRGDYEDKAKAD